MNASTAALTTTSTSATTTTSAATVRPSLWKPGLLAGWISVVAVMATSTLVGARTTLAGTASGLLEHRRPPSNRPEFRHHGRHRRARPDELRPRSRA